MTDVVAEISRQGLAELHTHLGGSVDAAVLWTLAHEQGIALPVKDYWDFETLVTVDPRGVEGLAAARRDLQVDRAHPVEPARRRALGARRDRRRVPHAEHHDARASLQPDEAKPRRRARPRPHHHGRGPRPRPREPRVSTGACGPDPDDGSDVHARAERGHRREGDPLRARGGSSASTSPARGPTPGAIPTATSRPSSRWPAPPGSASRSTSARRAARTESTRSARSSSTFDPSGSGTGSSPPGTRRPCALLRDAGTVLEICPSSNLLTRALADEDALRDTCRTFADAGVRSRSRQTAPR